MTFLQFTTVFTIFISLFILHNEANAGVMHSHSGEINKEREADGAYSPRAHDHFSDDSEEHSSEFDHEAILGSRKEAEEYDSLSPEEAKKRLEILLKKMDLDGNRQIDRKELKAWIIRSFKMLSEEEARDRMEEVDEDNDGIVTWAEYWSDTYGLDEDEQLISDDNLHLIQNDKAMWNAADTNGDGSLNRQEWASFSHPEEHPNMLPIILQHTITEKDTDGDGSINFQEFIGDRGGELGKEALLAEKARFDDILDKNHDGKLDGNEILSWVVPSNEEIAEEEVDHLFAHSDDDHDDILSFKEILDHHDTFVGSEVTDYGDHLHNIHHFIDEL